MRVTCCWNSSDISDMSDSEFQVNFCCYPEVVAAVADVVNVVSVFLGSCFNLAAQRAPFGNGSAPPLPTFIFLVNFGCNPDSWCLFKLSCVHVWLCTVPLVMLYFVLVCAWWGSGTSQGLWFWSHRHPRHLFLHLQVRSKFGSPENLDDKDLYNLHTFFETNIVPETWWLETTFLLSSHLGRSYVNFREGVICPNKVSKKLLNFKANKVLDYFFGVYVVCRKYKCFKVRS